MSAPRLTELALITTDVAGLTDFYERVLDVAPAEQSDRHAVFQLGELVLRIDIAAESGPGDPPADDHVAFTVEALDDNTSASRGRACPSTVHATSRGAAPPTCATPTAALTSSRRRLVFLKHKLSFGTLSARPR